MADKMPKPKTKRCTQCKQNKPRSAFGKHTQAKDGLNCWCRPCARKKTKQQYQKQPKKVRVARVAAWKKANPDYARDNMLRRNYGISLVEYNDLLESQGGVCAICGKPPKKLALAVDHDHKTKHIRGLLCHRCNRGLPWLADSAEVLRKAADYLDNPPPKVVLLKDRRGRNPRKKRR